jgi:hypothetical protein
MGIFGNGLVQSSGGRPYVLNTYETAGSFCWCKCTGAKIVGVIVIGGGGGGGDSTNVCTLGCSSFVWPGGGGAGGGGVSYCIMPADCVASPAAITVGSGGTRGYPGTDGAKSCFVGGITVCAGGGEKGQQSSTINSPLTNGGPGGLGSISGNRGGAGIVGQGCNARECENTTRGGAGGGGGFYCNVIPTTTCTNPPGNATALPQTLNVGWNPTNICLASTGKGGDAGNTALNGNRSVTGTNGNAGLVYVVQYF